MERRAFSVVELLVVIAVLAVLFGLVLPAIQSARETARSVQCKNNLKQIGTACAQYEATYGMFPSCLNGASWFNSFYCSILPYLEQEQLYEQIQDLSARGIEMGEEVEGILRLPMPILQCPSETSFNLYEITRTCYSGNIGNGAQRYGYNGMFRPLMDDPSAVYRAGPIRVQNVPDGLSNTAMVCEILPIGNNKPRLRMEWEMPVRLDRAEDLDAFADYCAAIPPDPIKYGWKQNGWKGGTWANGGGSQTKYHHALTPNQPSCTHGGNERRSLFTAGSNHPQGVNTLFADGHVKLIADSISRDVWRDYGSRIESDLRFSPTPTHY